jgi:hypothetical protein
VIRFAAIPKCASRSLKALGLLGELEGRCHTKITEYPNWERFQWFAVDRPEWDWNRSWWLECKRTRSMFATWAGLQYQDLWEDMERLSRAPVTKAPQRPGLNALVPDDFAERFPNSGTTLKEFCFAEITAGIPVEVVPLADLDAWLTTNGFEPVHMNAQVEHA